MAHRLLLLACLWALVVPAWFWACPMQPQTARAEAPVATCCCAAHAVEPDQLPEDDGPCFCVAPRYAPSAVTGSPLPTMLVEPAVVLAVVWPVPVPRRLDPLIQAVDPGGGWLAAQRCIRLLV